MCWRLTVDVLEKVRQIEELRNELLHVSPCVVDCAPGAGDGEKLPVSVVEPGGGRECRETTLFSKNRGICPSENEVAILF